jgi:hypothetical protein
MSRGRRAKLVRIALAIAGALAAMVAAWLVLGPLWGVPLFILLTLYGVSRIDNHTGSCLMLSLLVLIVVLVMFLLLALLMLLHPH